MQSDELRNNLPREAAETPSSGYLKREWTKHWRTNRREESDCGWKGGRTRQNLIKHHTRAKHYFHKSLSIDLAGSGSGPGCLMPSTDATSVTRVQRHSCRKL